MASPRTRLVAAAALTAALTVAAPALAAPAPAAPAAAPAQHSVRAVPFTAATAAEQQAAPDRLPAGARSVSANVLGTADTGQFDVSSPQAAVDAMIAGERTMVAADSARAAYAQLLDAAVLAQLPPALQAVYRPLLEVRPEYLAAGFDEVEARYGGFDAYLEGLGVDARQLRRNLLVG